MRNFIFENRSRIIFGKGTEETVGQEIKKYANKVLIHYGGGSVKATGLYEKIINSLSEADVEFVELSGVKPNPRLSLVKEGIKICREEAIEFILAVGGGSVIDSAKAIAAGVNYNGDTWDLFSGIKSNHKYLNVGTILTIPAAGSETSATAVITNEETNQKYNLPDREELRPVFAILNPELTMTLPKYHTACGIADMFAHVLERYFTNITNVDLTDRLCEATMKAIVENGIKVIENPNDYHARAEIMLCGTMAHNGLLNIGRKCDWASHGIEHEISAMYDIAHGAGLSIIFPAWMKFVYKHDLNRFAQFGNRVFNVEINEENLEKTAVLTISKVEEFFKKLELPISFKEANIPSDRIEEMADKAVRSNITIGNYVPLSKNDVVEIFKLAL